MKEIEQGTFYKIRYTDTYKEDTLESVKPLKIGRYYTLKNGKQIQILKKLYFKYTYEDIDNVRVMMEDYDIGTVQYNLCIRMTNAFKDKTPNVRFSSEEREILWYVYNENEYISESQRNTLRKILNIK